MEEKLSPSADTQSTSPNDNSGSLISTNPSSLSKTNPDQPISNASVYRRKTVLCAWEMGGNLGHLTNLKLFADQALKRGHRVVLAVRELQHVHRVFAGEDVEIWQAPHLKISSSTGEQPYVSYTDMVLRQGFGSEAQLKILVRAWRQLYDVIKPDLVIYDHAPSALIASAGASWKKWVVGSGFLIPRTDVEFLGVFPDIRRSQDNSKRLQACEERALSMINSCLREQQCSVRKNLKSWFEQCDHQLLTTWPQLDHYGERPQGDYIGPLLSEGGIKPVWPITNTADKEQPKVFVYVNEFVGLTALLDVLASRAKVLLYCKNLSDKIRRNFAQQIEICDEPVDMVSLVKSGCYFVTNANHGTSAQALLTGMPQLMIPLQREQYLLAVRIKRAKQGVLAFPDQPDFSSAVEELLQLKPFLSNRSVGVENSSTSERITNYLIDSDF